MRLVVDANIIFSALIKDGITAELLFDSSLDLVIPAYFEQEFLRHKQEIVDKTKRSMDDFERMMRLIKEILTIYPESAYKEHLKIAEKISPDKDDTTYIAVALLLDCSLWSNDKKLKEQNAVRVYTTDELITQLQ